MVFESTEIYEKIFRDRDVDTAQKHIVPPRRTPPSATENRSCLMLSANNVRHLNKLDTLSADTVIINLEDGVAPEQKEIARYLAAVFISNVRHSHTRLVVRVNPLGEGGKADIALLNTVRPDAIRVPKVYAAADARRACALIDPAIEVHFSVETKEAFADIGALKVDPRVTTFYLGVLDLLADLAIPQSVIAFGNRTMEHLMAKFLVECKTAGVTPVSFTYQEYTKLESFRHWCKRALAMGYTETSCLSPKQVSIANEVFGQRERELEKARYVIERFETMAKKGVTGFTDDRYGFIDEPIYKGALSLLKGTR